MSDTYVKVAGTLTGVAIGVAAGVLLDAPRLAAAALVAPLLVGAFRLAYRQAAANEGERV
jgi:hypothetical protein